MTPDDVEFFANLGAADLRWWHRRHSWARVSDGGFDKSRYAVSEIKRQVALDFVTVHHYSGSFSSSKQRYGMWEKATGRLVGVAVYGNPMHVNVLLNPFPTLEPYYQSLELTRLVLLNEVPANAESWFVTQTLQRAAAKNIRGVVMMSDPMPRLIDGRVVMPGHVGTLYQAMGRVRYLRRCGAQTLWFLPDGTVITRRSVSKLQGGEQGAGGVLRRLVALGADERDPIADLDSRGLIRRVRSKGNHRYGVVIGDRGARRATPMWCPDKDGVWQPIERNSEPVPFPKRADPIPTY